MSSSSTFEMNNICIYSGIFNEGEGEDVIFFLWKNYIRHKSLLLIMSGGDL